MKVKGIRHFWCVTNQFWRLFSSEMHIYWLLCSPSMQCDYSNTTANPGFPFFFCILWASWAPTSHSSSIWLFLIISCRNRGSRDQYLLRRLLSITNMFVIYAPSPRVHVCEETFRVWYTLAMTEPVVWRRRDMKFQAIMQTGGRAHIV